MICSKIHRLACSRLALLLLCLPIAACLNNNTDCVPSNSCDTVQPTTAVLHVNINTNAENPSVPVAIYYGNASDSNLYFRDTLTSEQGYTVNLGQRFSGVAKYRRGNLTILAVDGDNTRLKSKSDCDLTCYSVKDATLSLKLAKQ